MIVRNAFIYYEKIINMNEYTNHKVLSLWINDFQDSTNAFINNALCGYLFAHICIMRL